MTTFILCVITAVCLWLFFSLRRQYLKCRELGRARWALNRDRKFGSALSHGQVVVWIEGCPEPERWHFTPNERDVMRKRAISNPEDVTCG